LTTPLKAVKLAGGKYDDELAVAIFLQGLPDSWENFKSSWSASAKTNTTLI